ncbi:MAG TPA: LysR family transcriptional regulator, partial [Vicinamibacterales bacterium]|nr:LysR family transcriptional regulator [Vicinamibacterales bacterium]
MDFRHLRAFIAVAEESSVTKAAARLHISQPPLSRHIRQLEEELGITLFVRHRQGVKLTEEGQALLEKAKVLASAASDFYETAGQTSRNQANRLRVGIGWGLWETVNKVRIASSRQFANITIDASDMLCTEGQSEHLVNRSLDLLFARPPFETVGLESVMLYQERILAVISSDHPLASRKTLRIRDLANEPLLVWDRHLIPYVFDKIDDLYARAGIVPKRVPTPDAGPHNQAGLMMVASGKGIYLCMGVPSSTNNGVTSVTVVPLSDPEATLDVCVAWRKDESSP